MDGGYPENMVTASLLTAISIAALGFDYKSPEFWSKDYNFPEFFCVRRLAIEVPSQESVEHDAEKCGVFESFGDGKWNVNCRLAASEAERVLKKLKAKYRVLFYEERCRKGRLAPELDYKSKHLTKEAKGLRANSRNAPALTGLLEAEGKALDEKIQERDLMEQTALVIIAVLPGTQGNDGDVPPPLAAQTDSISRRAYEHPWARRTVPPCLQVDHYELRFKDEQSRAKAHISLAEMSEEYKDPDCPLATDSSSQVVYLSTSALQSNVFGLLEGIRSINLRASSLPPGTPPDDEKAAALERDRDVLGARLRKAPHVEALLHWVLPQLNDRAAAVSRLRQGTLILIRPEN